MGLDIHGLYLVRLAAKSHALENVITMGRQGLHVPKAQLDKIAKSNGEYGEYCENLLKDQFGATKVDSLDYSDFEQATHIADLNKPVDFSETWDTVIDVGTLEHVFDVVQALKNVSKMCRIGGRILHVLPASNMCNHGFWQFSPELFFSLYSDQNGYSETRVFLAVIGNDDFWYEVTPPSDGHWDYTASDLPMYVVVQTTKKSDAKSLNVQQAQYVNDWQSPGHAEDTRNTIKKRVRQAVAGTPLLAVARYIKRLSTGPEHPLRISRNLVRKRISDIV